MTAKKSLKKRVRARQQETGERYTEALEQVRAQKENGGKAPRVVVEEMPDFSPLARTCGIRAQVWAMPMLWKRAGEDPRALMVSVFTRLVEVLKLTRNDPTTVLLRGVLLEGKQMPFKPLWAVLEGIRDSAPKRAEFTERLRLGLRGVSSDGTMIAFEVPWHEGEAPWVLVASMYGTPAGTRLHISLADEWLQSPKVVSDFYAAFLGLAK